MKLIKKTNFNFLGSQKFGFVISSSFILAGIISLALRGGPVLGIDFTGGTIVQIQMESSPDVSELRSSLDELNIGISEVQTFGSSNEIIIRIKDSYKSEDISSILTDVFSQKFPNEKIEFRRFEAVGPKIGSELQGKALISIIFAIIGILIYISIRFEVSFAIGAISALVHDVLITLGIFSILGYEISLPIIAAFLTIVGYSLNDTIVVFDRIRENLKKIKSDENISIFNQSINESLSRTVITSLTTFIVVFILYLSGGEVIKYFAFAMIIGVMVGTYSSIYIASPVVLLWQKKFNTQN